MEPLGERFERSIPDQEERMKELVDNFKRGMMERFQEQEERIVTQKEKNTEQDLKIARQSETILKLEETIAAQQKTIEEQHETIQGVKAGTIWHTASGYHNVAQYLDHLPCLNPHPYHPQALSSRWTPPPRRVFC